MRMILFFQIHGSILRFKVPIQLQSSLLLTPIQASILALLWICPSSSKSLSFIPTLSEIFCSGKEIGRNIWKEMTESNYLYRRNYRHQNLPGSVAGCGFESQVRYGLILQEFMEETRNEFMKESETEFGEQIGRDLRKELLYRVKGMATIPL